MEPSNWTEDLLSNRTSGWAPGQVSSWLLGAFLSLACVVGATGNLYTLVLTCRWSGARGRGGSLASHVASLAAADLLYLSTAPFIVYSSSAKDWAFGSLGCRILLTLDLGTMNASVFTLCLMSAERYVAVLRPLQARAGPSRSRTVKALIGAWLLASGLSLPMTVTVRAEDRALEDGTSRRLCTPSWSEEVNKLYLTVLFVSSALGPGLVMVGLYSGLAWAYWKSQRSSPAEAKAGRSPRGKVLFFTSAVVLSYWACFLPFWIWQLVPLYLDDLGLSFQAQGLLNDLLSGLTYANSCIDPFLYTLLTRNYRERLRDGRAARRQAAGGRRSERAESGKIQDRSSWIPVPPKFGSRSNSATPNPANLSIYPQDSR